MVFIGVFRFVARCVIHDNCRSELNQSRNDPILMQYHGKGRYPDGGPIRIVDLEDPSTWAKPEPAGRTAGADKAGEADVATDSPEAEGKPIMFTQPMEDMSMAAVLGRLSPKNQPTPRDGTELLSPSGW
jgi:hypothetical protein